MGDPARHIYLPVTERLQDIVKILPVRVSAGKQRQLTAMEIRVAKGDIPRKEAHKCQTATMRDKLKAVVHGFSISRRVKYCGWQVTGSKREQLLLDVVLCVDAVFNAE